MLSQGWYSHFEHIFNDCLEIGLSLLKTNKISKANFGKIDFSEICFRNFVGFWRTRANFWTVIEDMLKMTVPPLSQYDSRKRQEFLDF